MLLQAGTLIDNCILQRRRMSYGYWNKEIVSTNPEVVLFHGVIDDAEISGLIALTDQQVK